MNYHTYNCCWCLTADLSKEFWIWNLLYSLKYRTNIAINVKNIPKNPNRENKTEVTTEKIRNLIIYGPKYLTTNIIIFIIIGKT